MLRSTLSRRAALQRLGIASAGVGGAIALAACGETQVVTKEVPVEKTVIKEVPVEKIVTQVVEKIVTQQVETTVEKIVTQIVEVEKIVTAEPQAITAVVRMAHDHTSGPRGAAMAWALENIAKAHPNIAIKFEPQTNLYMETFGIQLSAGSQAEIALLDGGFVNQWLQQGGFTQINENLAKHPDWDPNKWYFSPDEYTLNFVDALPAVTQQPITGPQFGMPFQGGLYGQLMNFTLAEELGIPVPGPGDWTLEGDLIEATKKATDADKGTWGIQMHSHPSIWWGNWAFGLSDTGQHVWRNPEGTHFTALDGGGDRGFILAINTIHDLKVSFRPEAAKEVAGEFGDPFSAGTVLLGFHGGGVGGTIPRIGDRFTWGLIPQPEGPRGTIPVWFSNQPHMITNAAAANGTTEAALEVIMYMAGIDVQGRITIDRGNAPVLKEAFELPSFDAPPPEGHGSIHRLLIDRDDHRGWQGAHPSWWEWYAWVGAADKGFLGEETPEQNVQSVIAASDLVLDQTKDQYDEYKAWAATLTG